MDGKGRANPERALGQSEGLLFRYSKEGKGRERAWLLLGMEALVTRPKPVSQNDCYVFT